MKTTVDVVDTKEMKNKLLFVLPLIMLVIAVYGVIVRNIDVLFYSFVSLVLSSFLPILSRLFKKDTEAWKNIAVELFILFAVYLANIYRLYDFWWYDIVLHLLSGVFIALIVPQLLVPARIANIMSAMEWACLSIIIGLAAASFWEILEFLYDIVTGSDVQRNLMLEQELLGTSWQNSGIKDTMNDIINGAIGSLIGAILNYFLIKRSCHNHKDK